MLKNKEKIKLQKKKSYIKEIIVDLKDLINNPEHIDETGLDVQIQADAQLVTNNLILLDNELMKENVANETIMKLFEEIIEPLNSGVKSKQVYEVLSEFLKQHFNTEKAETENEETENEETEKAPAPAGGSKSAKKRFKTQKRRKGKSASKSVKRRRRKRTNKSKLNKKRATKRSRK